MTWKALNYMTYFHPGSLLHVNLKFYKSLSYLPLIIKCLMQEASTEEAFYLLRNNVVFRLLWGLFAFWVNQTRVWKKQQKMSSVKVKLRIPAATNMKVKWSCNHLSDAAPALHFCEKKWTWLKLFGMYVQKLGEDLEFVTMVLYWTASVKRTKKLLSQFWTFWK